MTYYVIDSDGSVSWHFDEKDPSKDCPEVFHKEEIALNRAKGLAAESPGEIITVAKSYIEVVAPVGEVKVRELSDEQ